METVVGKPLTGFAPKEYDVLFGVTNRAHEDEVMAARRLLREVCFSIILVDELTQTR
jgi:hypothetical protein